MSQAASYEFDSRILNRNMEGIVAGKNRQDKNQRKNKPNITSKEITGNDSKILNQGMQNIFAKKNREEKNDNKRQSNLVNQYSEGLGEFDPQSFSASLAYKLSEDFQEGKFTAFMFVLLISVFKDILDVISLGTIGTVVNYIIHPFWYILIRVNTSFSGRIMNWIIRKYIIKKLRIAVVIEYIPLINFFPAYTITVIQIKMKIDKENRLMREKIKELRKNNNIHATSEMMDIN